MFQFIKKILKKKTLQWLQHEDLNCKEGNTNTDILIFQIIYLIFGILGFYAYFYLAPGKNQMCERTSFNGVSSWFTHFCRAPHFSQLERELINNVNKFRPHRFKLMSCLRHTSKGLKTPWKFHSVDASSWPLQRPPGGSFIYVHQGDYMAKG